MNPFKVGDRVLIVTQPADAYTSWKHLGTVVAVDGDYVQVDESDQSAFPRVPRVEMFKLVPGTSRADRKFDSGYKNPAGGFWQSHEAIHPLDSRVGYDWRIARNANNLREYTRKTPLRTLAEFEAFSEEVTRMLEDLSTLFENREGAQL